MLSRLHFGKTVILRPQLVISKQSTRGVLAIFGQPPSHLPHKGQGLEKYEPKIDKNSFSYKFIQRRIKDQEWGEKYFPLFPDILFAIKGSLLVLLIGKFLHSIFPYDYFSCEQDVTLVQNKNGNTFATKTTLARLYSMLPLRVLSKFIGKMSEVPLYTFTKPYILGAYVKIFNINMEEALDPNIKHYKSLQELFTRKIKTELRPIENSSDLVSPCDGKVLHFGKITNGTVEQIKGITYSLERFLGPISNKEDKKLVGYENNLMENHKDNELYHCVIYLAPGDYHAFHSPADWTILHRRHFPGELFSVNPSVAAYVKNLFILNERVVLSGKWQHGFFSMIAVGATNVGSIEINDDVLLKTNRSRKLNAHYDLDFSSVKTDYTKGESIGQFNLGSTIVLIFEAPKNFDFSLNEESLLKFGKGIGQCKTK